MLKRENAGYIFWGLPHSGAQAIRELTPCSIKVFQLENYRLKIIIINFQKYFFL